MTAHTRVGLIVPSSNVTMETEIPALLRQQQGRSFTFHSSRMPMRRVSKEELVQMDRESDRCARELSDASCDVLAYACLVAIMAAGPGYHAVAEQRLAAIAADNGAPAPVVTSAGALIDGIVALGATRVAIITPYLKSLTSLVVDYIEGCGIEVVDAMSLEVADNTQVGRLDPHALVDLASKLSLRNADALVLSACVQMPSLDAVQPAEDRYGLPVLSAATATAFALLQRLGVAPAIPGAGRLLRAGPENAKSAQAA